MSFRNLSDFLKALRNAGELVHITREVSPYLEISRFTDRESKATRGGKALYFERVAGSDFPVVTNIFGSPRRICMALGVDRLDQLAEGIREVLDLNPPENLFEALQALPAALRVSRFFPRRARSGTPPCQEVADLGEAVDLFSIPALHCWPKDAGRFITLPLVFTRSPVTGRRNVGMYRMQIFDRNTTGMHWHIHKDGSHYYKEYERLGRRMPVAVAIGADPATIYAATAPMPRGIDEMILAGFIRKEPVPMARCLTVDLQVPAEAEFVLEGYVDPGELRREGPFGDHTGYYSPADDYPVFHVTALTRRRKPVYCTTLVGPPPMEDCYLAKATERMFLPLLQMMMPEIRDYWFPWEGVFHNIVIVSIDKEYAGHAQKLMNGLWGQGQMSFCKAIVVVDGSIDPGNPERVARELLTRIDLESDITLTRGVLDVLDHSSPFPHFGHKIGIDLTPRIGGEPPRSPRRLRNRVSTQQPDEEALARLPGVRRVREVLRGIAGEREDPLRVAVLAVDKDSGGSGARFASLLLEAAEGADFDVFVLFDPEIDLSDGSLLLWKLFNNVDPGRDLVFHRGRLVIDACRKGPIDGHPREWPESLSLEEPPAGA